jgi:hypothetical protein
VKTAAKPFTSHTTTSTPGWPSHQRPGRDSYAAGGTGRLASTSFRVVRPSQLSSGSAREVLADPTGN